MGTTTLTVEKQNYGSLQKELQKFGGKAYKLDKDYLSYPIMSNLDGFLGYLKDVMSNVYKIKKLDHVNIVNTQGLHYLQDGNRKILLDSKYCVIKIDNEMLLKLGVVIEEALIINLYDLNKYLTYYQYITKNISILTKKDRDKKTMTSIAKDIPDIKGQALSVKESIGNLKAKLIRKIFEEGKEI